MDTLIEQGIKDGTLNGLSEKWLKAPLPASRVRSGDGGQLHFSRPAAAGLLPARLWVTGAVDGAAGDDRRTAIGILGAAIRSGRPGMLGGYGADVEIIRNTPFVVFQLFLSSLVYRTSD